VTLGHGCRDHVLRTVAAVARESMRGTEVVGRCGGEELVILLPATTPQGVHLVLERLRRRIEKMTIASDNGNVRVTVSVGAYVWPYQELSEVPDLATLVAPADEAMYEAKRQGRNRVIMSARGEPHDDPLEVRQAV